VSAKGLGGVIIKSFLDKSFRLRPVQRNQQVDTRLVGEFERQVVLDVVLCRLLLCPAALVVLPSLLLLLLALRYFPTLVRRAVKYPSGAFRRTPFEEGLECGVAGWRLSGGRGGAKVSSRRRW
jgi:hypothetical protein